MLLCADIWWQSYSIVQYSTWYSSRGPNGPNGPNTNLVPALVLNRPSTYCTSTSTRYSNSTCKAEEVALISLSTFYPSFVHCVFILQQRHYLSSILHIPHQRPLRRRRRKNTDDGDLSGINHSTSTSTSIPSLSAAASTLLRTLYPSANLYPSRARRRSCRA